MKRVVNLARPTRLTALCSVRQFSCSQFALARPPPRPDPEPTASTASTASLFEKFKQYQKNPKNRVKIAVAGIAFYIVVGLAGIQYLKDTKHKAVAAPSPYRKATDGPNGGIVEAHDTTPVYNEIAKEYDSKIWLEELTSYIWWMRRRLMKQVKGDALEVSCGTGRNVSWFKPKQVDSLTLVDSSEEMLNVCHDKYQKKFPGFDKVQFVNGRAEHLEELAKKSGQRFDTVFESFGLCSHQDPDAALQSMAALLKPNGKIVLLEHGRGPWDSMNQRMDEKAEERAKEWGCRWNLDIEAIIKKSGLNIVDQDTYHFGTIYWYVLERNNSSSAS